MTKKMIFLLSFFIVVFCINVSSYALFKVRGLGSIGYTMVDDDAHSSSLFDKNKINYGFGLQGIYEVLPVLGVGIDVGYIHLNEAKGTTAAAGDYSWRAYNILALAEVDLLDIIIVQAGAAIYLDAGSYPTTTGFDSVKLNNSYGFMLAAGIEIPVIPSLISIPIMVRGDFIFSDSYTDASGNKSSGTTTPIRLMIGVSVDI